jgi:hypothetical protein
MLYREIIAVCFQIHTKHINTLCGQNGELLTVKLVVHIVTTGALQRVSPLPSPCRHKTESHLCKGVCVPVQVITCIAHFKLPASTA